MIKLVYLLVAVNAFINPNGPTIVNDFVGCLNGLIETNFQRPGLLIFGETQNANPQIVNIRAGVVKTLHERLKFSVQIKTSIDKVPICNTKPGGDFKILHRDQYKCDILADYFMIIVDTYNDFIHLASKLIRLRSWNPYAKFIIALINFSYNESENIDIAENILSCLFRYNAIDVIVLIPHASKIRKALIYSWKPYDPPKFCGDFNETAKNRLILENTCVHGVIKEEKFLFYDKLPKNMMNCKLRVIAIERQPFVGKKDDPNMEVIFLKQMLGRFNFGFNIKLLEDYRGERNNSGAWNGSLWRLMSNEGQLLLGGIFPDFDVHEDFECSIPYFADSYTWVVPRAKSHPPWVALTIIFRSYVWYAIGVAFLLCVISWKTLGVLSKDSKYQKSLAHCLLNTWIITLGFSAYVRPVKRSLRVFFIFLNLYCTLLITAYQTKLIQFLQNPTSEEQLHTIHQLINSGLKFGGTEELHDLFGNSNDSLDNIIQDKWIDVSETSEALINVAEHRNFSVLCGRLELAHMSSTLAELTDHFGMSRYYTFDSNTFSVPLEMIALRGFPFMRKFSRTLSNFKQYGINEAVRKYYASYNAKKRATLLNAMHIKSNKIGPLTILILQGGFHALILGIVSGILVFVIEIIINCKYVRYYFAKFKRYLNRKCKNSSRFCD